MPRIFNYERAAAALADATLMGDRAAAEKYEVSVKSIEGWRSRLQTDPILRDSFLDKKRAQDKAWANEIPAAIAACINFLKSAAQESDCRNPEAIHAIAGALKIMSEVSITREVIDARLSSQDRSQPEAIG